MSNEIIKEYFNKSNKKELALYKVPKDDLNPPQYKSPTKNFSHQADLIIMPNEKFGYKYILVVVDIRTRLIDAEPLKNKMSKDILNGFNKIYKRSLNGLEKPSIIYTDSGGEFKNQILEEKGYNIYPLPRGHHLGIVDNKIYHISKALFYYMDQMEKKNNKSNKTWLKNLKDVIFYMNKNVENNYKIQSLNVTDTPLPVTKNEKILKIGDEVKPALSHPQGVRDNRFRATDKRFSDKTETIKNVLINPGSPIRYVLNNNKNITYTRNKLLLEK